MSKFVDRLQNLSRSPVSPIGFHAAGSKSKSLPMLLVAGLSGVGTTEAASVAKSNVDAGLILNQSFKLGNLKQTIKAMGDIPLGVFIRGITEKKVNKLSDSGCDFVVFDMKTPPVALQEGKMGKFLLVEPSLDQGLVSAINSLDIDGVFVNKGEEPFITVEHLLVCHRFSRLLDKPLVITLPSSITSVELSNLRKASIAGVVVPPAQPVEALAELRRAIDNLPDEPKHRRGKANVVLPHYVVNTTIEEEEEEEI